MTTQTHVREGAPMLPCPDCNATGFAKTCQCAYLHAGSCLAACPTCLGTKTVLGCAPWCPACAQERAAAAYARLAPKCPSCAGSGRELGSRKDTVPGPVPRTRACSDCSGSGIVREDELPCPTCAAVAAERTAGMAYYGETLPDCDHLFERS